MNGRSGFTVKQMTILNNAQESGEGISAWARRLIVINPDYTFDGYRSEINKLKKRGILVMDRDDLIVSKMVEYPDGSHTKVLRPPSTFHVPETSNLRLERMTTNPYGDPWLKYVDDGLTIDQIESVINGVLDNRTFEEPVSYDATIPTSDRQLNIIISDDHVGLDPDPCGDSIFSYKYDTNVYAGVVDGILRKIMAENAYHGGFKEIVINELGDQQDGWSGQTTRGGHDLPQNATNDEVLETIVNSRMKIIDNLVKNKITNKIIFRIVTKSNHTAAFSIVCAKAVKMICDRLYSADLVEIDILYKFMEHRGYGDHCFILTHGKDDKYMKKGLPYVLNDRAINFVRDYIDFYDLKSQYKYIHVWKGDSHRLGHTEHKLFDYVSFRALCPLSGWIAHNFGDAVKSGYAVAVVPKFGDDISMQHVNVEYKKNL